MVAAALFSSATEEWSTPQKTFDALDSEFHFDLDAAATKENTKCFHYFDREHDGLQQNWGLLAKTVWINPPYGRGVTERWVRKAYEESLAGVTVVVLLPSRTGTKWFQKYVLPHAEIRFLPGRLRFGGAKNSAPFDSVVVVFRPPCQLAP